MDTVRMLLPKRVRSSPVSDYGAGIKTVVMKNDSSDMISSDQPATNPTWHLFAEPVCSLRLAGPRTAAEPNRFGDRPLGDIRQAK